MKRLSFGCVLGLSLGLGVWSAQATVTVSRMFSDHAVLQRDRPLPVWGTASAGEAITVTLGAAQVTTNANAQGKWSVTLPAQALNAVGQNLTVSGPGNTNVVTDVLIGDVWMCGGQSNMELPLSSCDASADIAAANFPTIRCLMITNYPSRINPATDVQGGWQVCTSNTAPAFTGAGFYFARRVQSVTNVPIGIFSTAVGGTAIDSHIGPYGWALEPWLTNQLDYASRIANQSDHDTVDCVYLSRVHPAAPYAIKGALWYQGEWNGGDPSYYRKMRALIGGWRKEWNQGDFPFYYVQIHDTWIGGYQPTLSDPPQSDLGGGWAITRQLQFKSLQITNTGMALTIDIGGNGLHPTDKYDVGERLALWALRDQYGSTNPVVSGPLYREMQIEGNTIRLKFDSVGSGLMVGKKGYKTPVVEDAGATLNRFTIAGDDQVWAWANAVISGNEVRVWSPAVTNPVAARYAYSQVPDTRNLYNRDGLPASPFRTDEWGLMRPQGSNIVLCESWPTAWDGDFRFQAPYDTTVEGTIRSNKLTKLVVTPVSRRLDVSITAPYTDPMDFVTAPQPAMGEAPLTVSFDASAVTSYLGPITTYRWDFGDGSTALGAVATNTYAVSGVYTAMLQVVNALAQTDSVPRLITVTSTDTLPPTLVSVTAPNSTNKSVIAVFSEPVKSTDAQSVANYTVTPGVSIASATLGKDGRTVSLLTTAPLNRGDYTLAVSNIHDKASAQNVLSATNLPFRYEALYARWKLDEGAGLVAADSSGNKLPGTLAGALWTNSLGRKALSFDGQIRTMSTPTVLQGLGTPFSVACWINPAATQYNSMPNVFGNFGYENLFGNGGLVLQQGYNATNSYALSHGVGGSSYYTSPYVQLSANQWQHLAVVVNGTNSIIYLNGLEQGRSAASGTLFPGIVSQFLLGYAGSQNRYWNGSLSDVRLYRTALSAAEVQAVSSPSGLLAPTALTATAVNTHQIQLAWTDNATNETAYVVDRSPDGSAWNALTALAANATAYADDGLAAGTRYYYRVAATNSDGLSAYASATAMTFSNPPPCSILTSVSPVSVPEGGTNTFQVWLSSQPTSDVTVAVAWTAGDANLTVTGGASLTFTTNNWATSQTVTLAAAEDADAANGSATITCSGLGLVSAVVTAIEADNDATLTVNAATGGSTTPSGTTVVSQGAATGISASAGAGYVFANWSVTSGAATFANSNAASTTVTLSAPAMIRANFIHVAILTSAAFVGVPEGGTAKFRVTLTAQPAGSVTVSVAHSGDSQLSVVSGSNLVFSTLDWSLWKTVTLADAEDGVTNRRVATFTCSAAGMDPVIVTATGIDNDGPVPVDSDGDGLPDALEARLGRATNAVEVLTTLPFTERFESDTVNLGPLHGQHNWVVNPTNAATVQASDVFEGARALRIEGTNDSSVAVSQAFTSTPQTVWLDLRLKVAGAAAPGSIPDAATVFFFSEEGRLVVCDGMRPAGPQWITLSNVAPRQAGTWARLTARADYTLQTWALYLDGTNVAANLGFAMPQKRPICLSAEGPTGVLDSLYVGAARPSGIPGSNNTAPDDWYLDFLGTLVYGDADDPDGDGMNNLAEYLAGTNPNDIRSLLEVTETTLNPANPGEFIVRWQSATGRVYTLQAATNLMNDFSTLTNGIPATPTVNVYTDSVNGAGQKFYRVGVE